MSQLITYTRLRHCHTNTPAMQVHHIAIPAAAAHAFMAPSSTVCCSSACQPGALSVQCHYCRPAQHLLLLQLLLLCGPWFIAAVVILLPGCVGPVWLFPEALPVPGVEPVHDTRTAQGAPRVLCYSRRQGWPVQV